MNLLNYTDQNRIIIVQCFAAFFDSKIIQLSSFARETKKFFVCTKCAQRHTININYETL